MDITEGVSAGNKRSTLGNEWLTGEELADETRVVAFGRLTRCVVVPVIRIVFFVAEVMISDARPLVAHSRQKGCGDVPMMGRV